ncbi:MAG: hypothetical protein PHZ02_16470 [Desulfocapsaceae bacterium]|nr:hypothetical protein [Desulfocapsaceae bacterium]
MISEIATERCQKLYESYHDQFLEAGYSEREATEKCAHYYLDGKPQTKGLTPLYRSIAFWNCNFWSNQLAVCFDSHVVAWALGRSIHLGISELRDLGQMFEDAPKLLERGIRYSQLFLHPQSPLWLSILKLSSTSSNDFRIFLRVCDHLRGILEIHDKEVEHLKSKLAELTVFEYLLYGSLFAFQGLVSEKFDSEELVVKNVKIEQEISDALNQLLVWKLMTRPENDFKLTDWYLAKSLRSHLVPLILPAEGSLTRVLQYLKFFSDLMQATIDRNNFVNRSIISFCFDDDYRFKFDGDHLTLYPIKIPEESEWDRNGKKLNILHQYWFNKALAVYACSGLDETPFGLPENDTGNREAYIKAIQVHLQLTEIYGMDDQLELPNGTQVDLFKALHSLELMTAFFKAHFIDPFKKYHQISGDWIHALGQLAVDGLSTGQNRFPLTWAEPSEKARTIKSWTVSETHPEGNIKEAEGILEFWSNDLKALADRLKAQPNIPTPEFHEKPILKLGHNGFQLPWLTATQNNSTAAINNLRRIGSRRSGRQDETHQIENRLGEKFEEKGFAVVKAYHPAKIDSEEPGEVDLICSLEDHVFILELKSTYIRKSEQDAWIHYTTTLRKAAQQLKRKYSAVLSALTNDDSLRARLRLSDGIKMPVVHTWIVDTSIEYDQSIIDGFFKISLEGLLVILWNEQHFMNGIILQNDEIQVTDFFANGFSAKRFAEVVENGELWSFLQ